MGLNKTTAKEILALIPDELLVEFSKVTNVDYQVKKLYGRNVFYLLLFGLLESTRVSLRSLEDIYNSKKFRLVFNLCHIKDAKYNSISDRLKVIDSEYFERIYKCIYSMFSELYTEEEAIKYRIVRVDSTMIADAANKLEEGMKVGSKTNKKQIKYTINLSDIFPSSAVVYNEQQHLSEDKTIPDAILQSNDKPQDSIFVFDRGVQSREQFLELDKKHYRFVTRLRINAKHRVIKSNPIEKRLFVGNLEVISDEKVLLSTGQHKMINHPFRLIKTINKNKKEFWFLTNQFDLSAETTIRAYRKRWDIEVFFRFLKQEMNASHLISTNTNGIKVVLYMTLIAAILILVYKRLNNVGYKTAKRKFTIEMDDMIMIIVVKLCGGDPNVVFR